MIERVKYILKYVFGYDDFKLLQEKVIMNILNKRDTLVIMPTGGGKSLCYQIPALIFDGLTIVISPLISLMKDQVEQLRDLNISAVCLNSSLSYAEYLYNVNLIRANKVKLLYMAPEALLLQKNIDLLSNIKVDCITIDEAHCISEWGHDFRPEYRQLVTVRNIFHDAVCVALTATATPRVQKDIQKTLNFSVSNEFIAHFDRENLFLRIINKDDAFKQVLDYIKHFKGKSGIVYCFTRKSVEDLTLFLQARNIKALPYHAGLSDQERATHQDHFIKDNIQVIVATIAFGMGINKPDVRFVIHHDLPKNIESYYQEIGRAGRDGIESHCILLFSYADIHKINYFINKKEEDEKKIAKFHLSALIGLIETKICRRIPLLRYFGDKYEKENCGMCDNCLTEEKDLQDITIEAQKFLSCVKRTGERFGPIHIVDVLRGSKSKKVFKFGHEQLSTYNIGRDYSKKQWLSFSRQFLQFGLIKQDMEHGGLSLTPESYKVFRGQKVHGSIDVDVQDEIIEKHDSDVEQHLDYNKELFEILRAKRKEIADQANTAPYIIFSDKSLIEMSTYYPHSKEHFLNMHGVGEVKYTKYGEIFIDIITQYCMDKQIEEKIKPGSRLTPTVTSSYTSSYSSQKKKRYEEIGEKYNSGKTIHDIMSEYKIKLETVLNHLFSFVIDGNELMLNDDLLELITASDEEIEEACNSFEKNGVQYLKPVYLDINEKVSFDDLKLIRLYYLIMKNT